MRAFSLQRRCVALFSCRQDRFIRIGRGWIDLGVEIVGEVVDVLRRSDHGRHEAPVRRIGLVLVQHHDEVPDVGTVASVEKLAQGTIAVERVTGPALSAEDCFAARVAGGLRPRGAPDPVGTSQVAFGVDATHIGNPHAVRIHPAADDIRLAQCISRLYSACAGGDVGQEQYSTSVGEVEVCRVAIGKKVGNTDDCGRRNDDDEGHARHGGEGTGVDGVDAEGEQGSLAMREP